MAGYVLGDKFIYKEKEYKLESRIASEGEYIITVPNIYDNYSNIRTINDVKFYEPYQIDFTGKSIVKLYPLGSFLSHKEYYVITLIPKIKIKIGEDVIKRKLFGITFFKKVIEKYELKSQ